MTQGERLKEMREQMGLNASQFAEKIKISRVTLAKIENNIPTFSSGSLDRVCDFFLIPKEERVYASRLKKMARADWNSNGTPRVSSEEDKRARAAKALGAQPEDIVDVMKEPRYANDPQIRRLNGEFMNLDLNGDACTIYRIAKEYEASDEERDFIIGVLESALSNLRKRGDRQNTNTRGRDGDNDQP